ncbi:salicylate hydroxylase [Streptoalloteichus tenebrarius]|uniref:Salicylate hydroxylase n=1 Tax=Streptoalloteichus tenebrarius (strain ATCC 17920 / DSM 40477 / JCM 4838 / CBS 697.72 / NBRC 16177 / NCIMB 11028 / NRRL B-12390 / A12253. 1 / ISP 5477) TaxID=1933 RepID=A0ABT1I1K5_STRSD|nr:FAD-dependent monooxygenase [Streptoalloteichus tenebrarius]MCP2261667.1 salicylate hydroxylase [Streptoalloteichus tenebrarius]BFE99147.1 FAD-dependent monooxygenase [Streptoalloteichus tenebrarius]
MRPTVAVVGAGIGGLTAAIALHRRGVEVVVHEQASALTPLGAGIAVGANASRLLRRMGLLDTWSEAAVRPQRIQFHRWHSGRVFCSHEMGDTYEEMFGAPFYTVHRADAHRLLMDTYVREGGALELGHRCVAVAEDEHGVEVIFADGSATRAEVVVGADGVHSVVREALAGPDRPVFSGTSGYRGLAPVERLPRLPELGFDPTRPALWLFPGPGRHLISYPVSGGRLVNVLAVIPDEEWTVESWSARGEAAEALAAFAGWNEVVAALLGGMESVSRWALYDREPVRRWSSARMTLLGDAAHPMLPHQGQGANQAIEDAVVLADCLAGCLSDRPAGVRQDEVAAALRRYESVRRPRTRQLQMASRRNRECFQAPDGAPAEERDARLVHLPRDLAWIHGHDAQRELADHAD